MTATDKTIHRVNALCAKYGYVPAWKKDADGQEYACVEFKFSIIPLQERPAGFLDPLETFYAAAKHMKGVTVGQMFLSNGYVKSGIVTIKIKQQRAFASTERAAHLEGAL